VRSKVIDLEPEIPTASFVVCMTGYNSPANFFQLIPYDTSIFKDATVAGWNFVSHLWVCPKTDWYHVDSRVDVNAPSGDRVITSVYQNGAEILRGGDPQVAQGPYYTPYISVQVSGLFWAKRTDTIGVYLYTQNGGHPVSVGPQFNYCCIHRVSQ
jgi:hypothetical protein